MTNRAAALAAEVKITSPQALKGNYQKLAAYNARLKACSTRCNNSMYYENELPQPQDLVAFGLRKTKPCRINVSSKSSTMPCK